MTPLEIAHAVSQLARQPYDPREFPFEFLRAYGVTENEIKRLKKGATGQAKVSKTKVSKTLAIKGSNNKSDIDGAYLLAKKLHISTCERGEVSAKRAQLQASVRTAKHKAAYIIATDGVTIEAEDRNTGDLRVIDFDKLDENFEYFLALAGITRVGEIKEQEIDIKAMQRLNKLYAELLNTNEDWASGENRHTMNRFMARLIFCFFAEDTGIFIQQDGNEGQFTQTVHAMTEGTDSAMQDVLGEIFRTMNTDRGSRESVNIATWAKNFPFVNGGLFAHDDSVSSTPPIPRFSRLARSYFLAAGELDWKKITPDIFGSIIQVIAAPDERDALGQHYTSVPNILRQLEPLFLNDLKAELARAGDNSRILLNLWRRLQRIRLFDPACGSGNFLVVGYREIRKIEAEIIKRRKKLSRETGGERSKIDLQNFYGIEIKDFCVEVAKLSLLIAKFQSDEAHLGQKQACEEALPLSESGQIIVANALRVDWGEVCPPDHAAETYICGNPPYRGSKGQSPAQQSDLERVFAGRAKKWRLLDYIAGWVMKAADYGTATPGASALVSTNSICQGQQVAILWPLVFAAGQEIFFAYESFKWANLASNNAGVEVVIIGMRPAEAEAASHDDATSVRAAMQDETIPNQVRHGAARRGKFIYSRYIGGGSDLAGEDEGENEFATSLNDQEEIEGEIGGEFKKEAESKFKKLNIEFHARAASNINCYLVDAPNVVVEPSSYPMPFLAQMLFGNMPRDGGNLLLEGYDEVAALRLTAAQEQKFVRPFYGSDEFINGKERYCLWITDDDRDEAMAIASIAARVEKVRVMRLASPAPSTRDYAHYPHRFRQIAPTPTSHTIIMPRVSSESRPYLPVGLLPKNAIIGDSAFGLFDAPLWNIALLASRIHLVWIDAVCGKLKSDFRYSNTLGWNTFPAIHLIESHMPALTRSASEILLAREAHFPATIGNLYKKGKMPENLRDAHKRNDEEVESILFGSVFRNDTGRRSRLFSCYSTVLEAKVKLAKFEAQELRETK